MNKRTNKGTIPLLSFLVAEDPPEQDRDMNE